MKTKLLGAPCLNYLTVQVYENDSGRKVINLLAVYRNHDFTVRTYGNYLCLRNLLRYICAETDSEVGSITCISSHAYINGYARELKAISDTFLESESDE